MEEQFHLKFENDSIGAYFVEPGAEADVKFQMSSDVLDGIFTERLNVMGAAFSGPIVFQGDVEKAIMLQGFLGDFARVYRQACEKCQVQPSVGDAQGSSSSSGAMMRVVSRYAPAILGAGLAHKRKVLIILLMLFILMLFWRRFMQALSLD